MNAYLTITLPPPPKALRPNYRLVWQAKLKPKKEARDLAEKETKEVLLSAGGIPQGYVPTGYAVRWYYRLGVAPDVDNVLASCKAYIDGVCDALGVNDRDLECRGIGRVKAKAAYIELLIYLGRQEQLLF